MSLRNFLSKVKDGLKAFGKAWVITMTAPFMKLHLRSRSFEHPISLPAYTWYSNTVVRVSAEDSFIMKLGFSSNLVRYYDESLMWKLPYCGLLLAIVFPILKGINPVYFSAPFEVFICLPLFLCHLFPILGTTLAFYSDNISHFNKVSVLNSKNQVKHYWLIDEVRAYIGFLIERLWNINAGNIFGDSTLSIALNASKIDIRLITKLLSSGADGNKENHRGQSAYELMRLLLPTNPGLQDLLPVEISIASPEIASAKGNSERSVPAPSPILRFSPPRVPLLQDTLQLDQKVSYGSFSDLPYSIMEDRDVGDEKHGPHYSTPIAPNPTSSNTKTKDSTPTTQNKPK